MVLFLSFMLSPLLFFFVKLIHYHEGMFLLICASLHFCLNSPYPLFFFFEKIFVFPHFFFSSLFIFILICVLADFNKLQKINSFTLVFMRLTNTYLSRKNFKSSNYTLLKKEKKKGGRLRS